MKRFVSFCLALLLVAFVAFAGRDTSAARLQAAMCYPKPTLMQRGTMLASDIGSIVPALNRPIPYSDIAFNIAGAWWTVGNWFGTLAAAIGGQPTPDPVIEPVDCAALLNPCVTTPAPQTGTPYDPKSASLTGPPLAADALKRAGFPADEIPTFVAIAKHESGFDPNAWNDYDMGMAGMFQLNVRYFQHDDWRDPYANARMAKKARDESVTQHGNPYYKWSTWRSAVRDAGDYAQYGSPAAAAGGGSGVVVPAVGTAPADPPLSQTPESSVPAAPPTCGGVAETIGSWNVLFSNSPERINANAGFADLVGLQEIRDNNALKVPGYAVTDGGMAVPIIWRTDKLELVEWHREQTLTSPQDKWVVWGIWTVKASGQRFAAVNTHQLVEGGRGWDVQAVKVNEVLAKLKAQGLPVVMVGDFNASAPKIAATFGSAGVGHNIDRVIGYGATPIRQETLGYEGSDHRQFRAFFPVAQKTSVYDTASAPKRNGPEGIKALARSMGVTQITPHTDPQGQPAFDMFASGQANTDLAEAMRQHHDELGLRYVISQMRIASPREGWVWRDYTPITGSGDFRHTGHVHVSY